VSRPPGGACPSVAHRLVASADYIGADGVSIADSGNGAAANGVPWEAVMDTAAVFDATQDAFTFDQNSGNGHIRLANRHIVVGNKEAGMTIAFRFRHDDAGAACADGRTDWLWVLAHAPAACSRDRATCVFAPSAGENVGGCYFMMSGRVYGTNVAGGANFVDGGTGRFFTALKQGPHTGSSNAVSSTTDISLWDCACGRGCQHDAH
jgi:hypothetical protein